MPLVTVPCSTSNLGSGFDSIGLAFQRYLTVRYVQSSEPLAILRSGTLSILDDAGVAIESDAVVIAMRAAGCDTTRGSLEMHSDIPIGRGLGSSAAATVAGILLARTMLDATTTDALALATRIEGHPDNAAPALLGGLIAVARDQRDAPAAFALPLSERIGFAFASPDTTVSTAAARAALPATVPHPIASRMLGRVAALTHGLANAEPETIRLGLLDDLHVQYRLPLIPRARAAIDAAVDAGAWGATISGSGSGIIALGPVAQMDRIASAMNESFVCDGGRAVSFVLTPDARGAQVST